MTKEGWFRYTICEQMSNIGAEVHHFIEARDNYQSGKTTEDYSGFYLQKALDYLSVISEDPKNKHRVSEFRDCAQELLGLKAGVYTDSYILQYWDQYTEACAFRDQRIKA